MTADDLSKNKHRSAAMISSRTARDRRVQTHRLEDLAGRRMTADANLRAWRRYQNEVDLQQYVRIVGDGGTYASDFTFPSHEPTRGRPSLWPRCYHCGLRKHWSSFDLTTAEWAARQERQRQHLPVEPMWHGRSAYCSSCRIERESDDYRRYWHPQSMALARRGGSRPADTRPTFGAHIRQMREQRGLSQSALAMKAGLSRRQVVNLERGDNRPQIATVMRLARALDVGETELVPGSIKAGGG